MRVRSGLPYATVPGVRPLELDLYLPTSTAPAPVVVFLHGGGWRVGSRHSAGPAFASSAPFEQVAAAGIAVASVDYRLSGEAVWPAQLHDVKAAVRWLRLRSDDLALDPDRIAAWGESAGGHLAALLGLTADRPDLEGDIGSAGPSSRVTAVAAWYAPSDIGAVATDLGADPTDPSSREAQLLGAPVASVPDLAAQASPVSYASAAAPPFLLLQAPPTGSSRACRANGSLPRCAAPEPTSSSSPTRAPTTCGAALRTRRRTPSTARSPFFSRSSRDHSRLPHR